MTYGIKGLRNLQIGLESTAGVPAAATSNLRAEGVITDNLKVIFPKEDVGIASGTDRSYIPEKAALLAIAAGPATFENLGYFLNMGICGVAGAKESTGSTSSGYVYTRAFMTTAQKTPYHYTIQGGNNAECEQMEYCFVKDFVIEGKQNESIMRSANVIGRQVSTASYTTAVSIPTVEEMLFNMGKVYIDPVGSTTIGTTQVTNALVGFKITVTTGFVGIPSFDGSLYFSFVKQVAPVVKIDFTWEHETSSSIAQKVAWRAQTPKNIRLKITGSALSTAGVLYTNKTFIFDCAGKWEKFGPLTDAAGDDTVVGTFQARYNSTSALFATTTLVNELSALP